MRKARVLLILGATGMLSSCDLSQIPGLDKRMSVEDSKAVGAACRHAGRALEDCFVMNPDTHPAGVFEGWRDMNDYMTANNLSVVQPQIQQSRFKPKSGAKHGKSDGRTEGGDEQSRAAAPPLKKRPRFDPRNLGSPAGRGSTGQPESKPEAKAEPVAEQQSAIEQSPSEAGQPAPAALPRPWERTNTGKSTT